MNPHRVLLPPLLALAALLLAGCATRPPAAGVDLQLPSELPQRWAGMRPPPAATVSADGSDWWQGFADPLLPTLIDEALGRNLDLHATSATLARARALRELATASQGPSLGSGASVGRSHGADRGSSSLRLGIDARWEADLFGALGDATAAAQADVDAAAAMLQATRLAVAAETGLAYLQWQGAGAQRAVAAASLDSQQQTLELVQLRQRAGLIGGLEAEQARSSVEQARARVSALQHTQTQAEHALAQLLGLPPAALADRLAAAPRGAILAPALPLWPQPAELLQRRWDLQAAAHRIGAALATLSQRRAEQMPRFTISGNLALQAATLSALGGTGALVAGLVAAVDWSLFDSGAGSARVAAQQAALDRARIDWHAAVLAALRDVEDSLSARANAQARVASLQRASGSADEALRLARISYRAGLSDFLSLLDSERGALGAADALASARTELASSHVRLYQALGGGWGTDQPSTSTRP